ncbi:MAG: hypothetical protein AAFX45_05700 [Pseudomonadota bacterium]
MGDANQRNFEVRMNKINRRHKRLSRGYVMSVNHDGLIIAQPKARQSWIPWRGILFALVGTILVKAVMLAQVGTAEYQARVTNLAAGNQFEQIGAYVLTADPATQWIAGQMAPFLPGADS